MDRRRLSYLRQIGVTAYIPRDAVVTGGSQAAPGGAVAPGRGTAAASAEAEASARRAGAQGSNAGAEAASRTPEASPAPEAAATVAASAAAADGEAAAGGEGSGGAEAPGADPEVAGLDWDALAGRVAGCEACRLHEGRTQTVFGVGDRAADLVMVGEGPGAEEDRQGEPFVGRAGRLLDAMLAAIGRGRSRGGVYICNIIKCRPPGNRDPRPDEVAACSPYLRRQLELLEPRAIVALGRVAAQRLLDTDKPLARLRGQVHTYPGTEIPVWVTYHPAYLLRSPGDKAKAWQDLKRIRELVAGPEAE